MTGSMITVEAKQTASEAATLLHQCGAVVVSDARTYQLAGERLKEIKSKAKTIETLRKTMTKPLDDSKKAIMAFFKTPQDELTKAESIIKGAMTTYAVAEDKKRQEAEAKERAEQEAARAKLEALRADGKEAEADDLEMDLIFAAPTVIEQAKVDGVSMRDVWKYRIIDEDKIDRKYLIINTKLLGDIARSTKGTVSVEGVEFYSEKTMSARADEADIIL